MEQNLSKAFTEVYEILKVTPIELTSKIPTKFRKIIEENRDKEYRFQLEEPFNEKDLKEETIVILGLIYRDFICSAEERDKLQEKSGYYKIYPQTKIIDVTECKSVKESAKKILENIKEIHNIQNYCYKKGM